MSMKKVYATDYLQPPATVESDVLADVAQVECLLATDAAQLIGRVDDGDGLLVFHEVTVPAEVIDRLRKCKVIVRVGVGFDNVDLRAAGAKGIPVCNVPDYGVDEVADHAIGLLLACHRGISFTEKKLRKTLRPWTYASVPTAYRLAGATMGIIGLGRIGTAAARRAQGMRMKVIACDPYIPDGRDKSLDVRMVDLDTLLAEADAVSIHTPLTDETRGMIGPKQIGRMKKTAILVNTARGPIVDTDAVADALEAGTLLGAGLDVLPTEPADASSRIVLLWQRDDPPVNLVLTPHSAFYSEQAFLEMRTKAATEVRRVLAGDKPRNPVNLKYLQV